ncbi:hypothetical protein [Pseudomonas putida]|uniref:hypothetical protein n=1 Tax=Pseudomonas putida TaxID=303 RepID=UPI0039063425
MDMPDVSHLNERMNSVDLDALGSADLMTWISYPGIAEHDLIYINWRGCKADNSAEDLFGEREVLSLDAGRGEILIDNALVTALRGGQVFYSFTRLDNAGNPVGPESKRRFFFVDRPAEGIWALPVAHLQDAHEGVIDVNLLNPEGILLATAPYAAMAKDDKVFLSWEPWFNESMPGAPIEQVLEVQASDPGRPLLWHLEVGEVFMYLGGFAFLHYRIEFADGTSSRSPVQRFDIVSPAAGDPPPASLLAAPRIPGATDGALDPDDETYRAGLLVEVDPYPELELGDSLVLYAVGPEVTLRSLRVDASSVDSKRLTFHLEREWLQSEVNRGKRFAFSYEFSRQGAQRRSQVLDLVLQRKLYLPLPIIPDATQEDGDASYQGVVHPSRLESGAKVRIPAEAELGDGAEPAPTVNLHWEGHGSTGAAIVPRPPSGDTRLFTVPRSAMAANLGRRLWVYYTVTRAGETPRTSEKFELRVSDFDQRSYPIIQVEGAENRELKLHEVPVGGALCTLPFWTFMAEGQLLGIEALGRSASGQDVTHILRPPTEAVTYDEYSDGVIKAYLPKQFLGNLDLGKDFRLTVSASFDDGETWRAFPIVDLKLVS